MRRRSLGQDEAKCSRTVGSIAQSSLSGQVFESPERQHLPDGTLPLRKELPAQLQALIPREYFQLIDAFLAKGEQVCGPGHTLVIGHIDDRDHKWPVA